MKSFVPLFPENASTLAGQVDWLYFYLVGVSVFFTILIALLILVLGIKYRRKAHLDRPAEIHGNNALEITWTVIPLILVMVMFFWGADLFFKLQTPPKDSMEILVTGKQWMWKLQHPNGKREINNLHVPLGQPIKLTMTSEDVIHSFYVPAFRVKQDVLPGRYTSLWFEPTKEGEYHLFCAEYCGTEHSVMGGKVYVMQPSDYEAWVTGAGGASLLTPAEAGAELFVQLGCVACHDAGDSQQGPSLVGKFGTEETLTDGRTVLIDENYVRESILNPQAKIVAGFEPLMTPYKGIVSETQLHQLVAYIKSLAKEEEE